MLIHRPILRHTILNRSFNHFKSTFKPFSTSSFLQNYIQSNKSPKTTRTTNVQKLRRTKRIGNGNGRNNGSNGGFHKPSFLHEIRNQQHLQIKPCTTFTTCESYDFDKILNDQNNNGLEIRNLIPNEILYFKFEKEYDVLILSNGSIVVWGMDESNVETKILPLLKPYMTSLYPFPESEDMDYLEVSSDTLNRHDDLLSSSSSYLEEDIIVINAQDNEQQLLDKAAFSSGLSRSTRLAIIENALERHILQTRKLSEHLSQGKKINLSEKELLKSTGRLFLLRGKLNLYSELIEIPDLYWSEPNLEKIYRQISNNLDISPRISILNKKLDYATDESRALMSTLTDEKSTRLEWIIIYLIMIEVCFEIFHFYERFTDSKEKKELVKELKEK